MTKPIIAVLCIIAAIVYAWTWFGIYGSETRSRRELAADSHPTTVPAELPKSYSCHKVDHIVNITGRGDDPAWKHAAWTDYFVDIQGDKKPPPRFATRAKMLWDDQYLYVYAELDEPHVWGTITKKNEVIFHDNDFEVFMDPECSGENYYEFEMNALNTIWELTLVKRYTKGGPAISPTNLAGLIHRVSVDGTINDPDDIDHGWSVEIAFPFAGLATHKRNGACPPVAGDIWRINFSRVEWTHEIVNRFYHKVKKPEDNWVWTPQGVVDMHQPEQWGHLRFVE